MIFTFNRLDHTKKTIEALKDNILASESEVYIYSDGARNREEEKIVKEVRAYLKEVIGFKSVNIIESDKNKGLANSVIDGVTDIINKYGKIIVLEDDLVTSKYFLKYMNDALTMYQERKDIWSVSGYTPKIDIPKDYPHEIYLSQRGCSWGWATWEDRWKLNDWEITTYEQFKNDKISVNRFNLSGSDMAPMLSDQMEGRIDSWAIRWVYNQFNFNTWTVYPTQSLVNNIGTDLSGTHSAMTTKFDVIMGNNILKINKEIQPNEEILKLFKEKYDLNIMGYLAIIIKKIGLYKQARKIRNKIMMRIKK